MTPAHDNSRRNVIEAWIVWGCILAAAGILIVAACCVVAAFIPLPGLPPVTP